MGKSKFCKGKKTWTTKIQLNGQDNFLEGKLAWASHLEIKKERWPRKMALGNINIKN